MGEPLAAPIGIFGGTFDPVHFGHLRSALELFEQLALQRLHLVPSAVPPHRDAPHATPEQRLAMLQLAVKGQPGFFVDEREIERSGPSYMVDTLDSLRAEVGQTPLCLILGVDAFLGIPDWHHWRRLLDLAHIVVAHRPGWSMNEMSLSPTLRQVVRGHGLNEVAELHTRSAGGVLLQGVTQLDVSATDIRARIAAGKSANYLLPAAVWQYIQEQDLYH